MEGFMSFPAQKSTIEAQALIALRYVRASSRWYVELLGADSIPEHPIATCTIGYGAWRLSKLLERSIDFWRQKLGLNP
jgi:hypothetical protein